MKPVLKKLLLSIFLFATFIAVSAQIVPNVQPYINSSGTAIGGLVIPGSVFITGSGSGLGISSVSIVNSTPTISSGFGTSPALAGSNGTFNFRVNVGTGGVATSGVMGMALATNGWNCQVIDMTTNIVTRETASTTTTVTVTAASAWTASDILSFICAAY